MARGGHNKLRIELECHVCQIRWCPLGAKVARRKTCSQECRHLSSSLCQRTPGSPYSMYPHPLQGTPPKLSAVATMTGVPFLTLRGRLGGQARQRALKPGEQMAMLRKAGKAASAYNRSPAGRERARRAAAITNHKRWGTPLPDGFV